MEEILGKVIKIYELFLASSTLDKFFVILGLVVAAIIISKIFKKNASQHIGNNSNNNTQVGGNYKGR